jgi:hypothetical protein
MLTGRSSCRWRCRVNDPHKSFDGPGRVDCDFVDDGSLGLRFFGHGYVSGKMGIIVRLGVA